ncbi:MAG: hypothetical protein NZM00_01340, partial [Anaerolinea sp.]|nr:hypothetical protein [Anaerolinea sp.]
MNRLGIVCACVALMLAVPALAQEMDYRTSAGLIFTYVPEAQTVVGNGSGLTVVDTRSGSIWTITGPLPATALVPPSVDDTSLEALADA